MSGYIKLFRSTKNWEWYKDLCVKTAFLHCLIEANWEENRHKGELFPPGSFPTSYEAFGRDCGLSVQQVRTSLKKLKSTGEITYETTQRGTIINVVKWRDYQGFDYSDDSPINTPINNQSTDNQQTINKQLTTLKNNKNIKNTKNINSMSTTAREDSNSKYAGLSLDEAFEIIKKIPFSTPLTEEEVQIVKMHDRAQWKEEPDD